ncbi:MAG: type II toxin-antitoxin system HigB family toxin [Planctomycetota bacterium]
MHVISRPILDTFSDKHPPARTPLETWWKLARRAKWKSLQDVRMDRPEADGVTLASGKVLTVFNIGGNKYRLVALVDYRFNKVFVYHILTHAEYDRGAWKDQS